MKWVRDGDRWYVAEGGYEYMVRKSETGEWEQLERYTATPEEPWLVNGGANTPQEAMGL